MAPRTLQMITCFNIAVHVPLPAGKEAIALGSPKKNLHPAEETIALGSSEKRPWTREIKRKILASVRRERIMPVKKEQPCDVVDVEKQRTTPAQSARPALKKGILKGPRDDGSPETIVAVDGVRKRKGSLKVRFDLPTEEEIAAVAPVKPPPFPKGVLGEPPESFRHTGPEMTAAFLASVVAGDADSAVPVDHDELVARRKERMEACSRRLSYLRDYCPFQREEDDNEEDEESTPETTTTTAEQDHAEEALPRVTTGMPFDCSESETEFVKAIRSSYLLKDDFVSRHAYERSQRQGFMQQDCLMCAGEGAQRFVQELRKLRERRERESVRFGTPS